MYSAIPLPQSLGFPSAPVLLSSHTEMIHFFYTFFIKMFKFSDYNESTGKTVQFGSFYILCLYRMDMEFIC